MSHITYTRSGAVGTISMNRPPANSYEISFMREFSDAITAAENDGECRVVIIRSSIAGFFCGGADIKAFHANCARENVELIAFAHETLRRPSASDRIYIAEIAGHCLGGGFEIALACDLRFAAEGSYKIGLPEAKLGLLPGNGGTQRLATLSGPATALDLMINGEFVDPERALALNMINRVYPAEELALQTNDYATKLSHGAPLAIAMIKRSLMDGLSPALDAGLAKERMNIARLFASSDAQEGFSAFIEKRPARFTGL